MSNLGEYLSKHSGDWHADFGNLELQKERLFREIVETVLTNITFKDNAVLCLEYECLSIAQETLYSCESEQIAAFSKQMYEFGVALFNILMELGAYQNGSLAYTYHGLVDNDIVLMHRDYIPFEFTVDQIRTWNELTQQNW